MSVYIQALIVAELAAGIVTTTLPCRSPLENPGKEFTIPSIEGRVSPFPI